MGRGAGRARGPRTRLVPSRPTASPLLQGAGGRPVLYQVVARHGYSAQGPEDLDLQPGDIVDVLCEGRAAGCPFRHLLGPPAHGLPGADTA